MPAEAGADLLALTIAKFDKALYDRSAFSCGFAPIDNFLKSSLSDQIKDGMVSAWITTEDGESAVLWFYILGAKAVRAEFGLKRSQRARVPDVPVTYIRAVAVSEDMQGKHLGTALVIDAMERCLGIADQMEQPPSCSTCSAEMTSTGDGNSMPTLICERWQNRAILAACTFPLRMSG